MIKVTIGITGFKEARTIGRAIEAFANQKIKNYEIIVSAPDAETLEKARGYAKKNKNIRVVKDNGIGKPSALNNLIKIARGEIVILSDADVYVSENAISELIKHFSDKKVGAVSGRVVSVNKIDNMFGFWAYALSGAFHHLRINEMKRGKNIICSGYLYAIRKNLFENIPEKTLADDAFVSLTIQKKGYITTYEPKAEVYVKYPDNLPDWIRQKKRTAGRFYQLKKEFNLRLENSFIDEIIAGIYPIRNINNFIKFFWFMLLMFMRLYIWARVLLDFRLWKRDFKNVWERVESTK